jgi:hypothetical protein
MISIIGLKVPNHDEIIDMNIGFCDVEGCFNKSNKEIYFVDGNSTERLFRNRPFKLHPVFTYSTCFKVCKKHFDILEKKE